MKTMLKFEWKKTWKSKKLLTLSLLALFSVSFMYFYHYSMQKEALSDKSNIYSDYNNETFALLTYYMETLNHEDSPPDTPELYKNANQMNLSIMEVQRAISKGDLDSLPKLELEFIQRVESHLELGGEFNILAEEDLKRWKTKNELLIQHELPYDTEEYPISTGPFMKSMLALFLGITGSIIFVLFFSDNLNAEYEQQTIRTLVTQPTKKWNILLSKYTILIIYAWIWAVFLLIFSLLIPSIFQREIGNFQYPQLVVGNAGHEFVDTSTFILQILFLFVGTASFVISLLLLISTICKKRFLTIIFFLVLFVGGSLLTTNIPWLTVSWNPFLYINISNYLETTENNNLLFPNFILMTYSFIGFLFSLFFMKKTALFNFESLQQKPFRGGNVYSKIKSINAILLFELRKVLRKGPLKQLVIILLIAFIGAYVYLANETNQRQEYFWDYWDRMVNFHKEQIIPLTEAQILSKEKEIEDLEVENSKEAEDQLKLEAAKNHLEQLNQSLFSQTNDLKSLEEMITSYEQEDWSAVYHYWIYQNQLWKGDIDTEGSYESFISNFTFEASIEEKKWLDRYNIAPLQNPEILYTIHEKKLDKSKSMKIDSTGLFSLFLFYDLNIYLGLFAIILYLVASIFSSEHGKSRTIDFLRTQPLYPSTLLTGKIMVSSMISGMIFLACSMLIILLGTISNRFGDWFYPVIHYDTPQQSGAAGYNGFIMEQGAFHFITMGEYLVYAGLLGFCSLFFYLSIAVGLAVFIKNEILILALTIFISIVGYTLISNEMLVGISHWLPFSYLEIGKVINGAQGLALENAMIHPLTGIVVLIISSVLIFAGTFICQKIYSR
ncbi:hypothetical protein BACCIP111883_03580 [Sutcliffiella rhizosphaerae]|uniref:ABC transporter permease n=2 Tax=Sutcliffiella rhizosphaerae TaxID=2880967 RepID=A0ABM8YS12_9BACI|nr:hypothetical protein BACCIP111883_03580 [Sutcliffiella rhizosphaerae]